MTEYNDNLARIKTILDKLFANKDSPTFKDYFLFSGFFDNVLSVIEPIGAVQADRMKRLTIEAISKQNMLTAEALGAYLTLYKTKKYMDGFWARFDKATKKLRDLIIRAYEEHEYTLPDGWTINVKKEEVPASMHKAYSRTILEIIPPS